MMFDSHTAPPASSSSLAAFVTAPPWIRSSISCTVAHSVLRPSTATRPTAELRSVLEASRWR